jgi:hypothetical protein
MDEEKKRYMLLTLSFTLFLWILFSLCTYSLFSLHTNWPSCPLYYVHYHIKTNRITRQEEEAFTRNVEEDIQRCMLISLFSSPLLCISFIVCLYIYIFLDTNLPTCRLYFLHFYIERNKIIRQEEEVLTKNVEEYIRRCMFLPLFYCMYFLFYCFVAHLLYVDITYLPTYQLTFMCTIFFALLHWNK